MADKKELTLEESFEALEEVISKLEDDETPLEEAFNQYKLGMDLLKNSNDLIDRVEKQVKVLSGEGLEDE
ncbi:MAG: exodeoxyribonuclease VII small subunit [Lachnospiraceae bacterium]|nr:exodeoxyribonuclease VII small subunit [Lachnospiraceae bacterium]MBR4993245.1 exodeoxyribonuclease VII small subunit [Lachnospiraceae bacterium]